MRAFLVPVLLVAANGALADIRSGSVVAIADGDSLTVLNATNPHARPGSGAISCRIHRPR